MPRNVDASEIRTKMRSRAALLDRRWTDRGIRDAVRAGRLRMIRRGWYVEQAVWIDWWSESRHLAHVIAVARDAASPVVMSHTSAAVLHALPLYGMSPRRVHETTSRAGRISSGPDVQRHVAELAPGDVVRRSGILCTSPERTIFDLSRTVPAEAALASADAAERARAARGREWDAEAAARWKDDMGRRIAGAAGARGIRRARRIHELTDGRAELPLESVTRLQLVRLGFPIDALQVPVEAPHGGTYFVDVGLARPRALIEVDGETKYRDEALRSGRSLDEVLLREKQREDWIRGVTGLSVVRAGAAHIRTPELLASRLASFGIRPLD